MRARLKLATASEAKATQVHAGRVDLTLLSKEFTHPPRQLGIRAHPLDGQ